MTRRLKSERPEMQWQRFLNQLMHQHRVGPKVEGSATILVPGHRALLLVPTSANSSDELRLRIPAVEQALRNKWPDDILILGCDWSLPDTQIEWGGERYPAAGALGQSMDDTGEAETWSWEMAPWATCQNCYQTVVFHPTQYFISRPCGHYESGENFEPPNFLDLARLWAISSKACDSDDWID